MTIRLLIIGLCALAVGCNSDPRCRRETALLRAEILDLEDKFYQTKSERDEALAALYADGKSDLASRIERRSVPDRTAVYDNMIYGDAVYDEPAYQYESHDGFYESHADSVPAWSDSHDVVVPPHEAKQPSTPRSTSPNEVHELFAPPESDSNPAEDSVIEGGSTGFKNPNINGRRASHQRNSTSAGNRTMRTSDRANHVAKIVIDRASTFVRYEGLRPVGMTVLLKPVNARGQTELASSDLTVSVVDPMTESSNQRLGVWQFLADEVELFLSDRTPESAGILLDLPFEEGLPEGDEIVVSVRYTTPDGRRLETSARVSAQNDEPFSSSAEIDYSGAPSISPEWRPVR